MNKVFSKADGMLAEAAKKFTSVSVNRGKTAFPKAPKDLENLGIRWDFDGEMTQVGVSTRLPDAPSHLSSHLPAASLWRLAPTL
jgi:hypothetical protein